MPCQPRLNSSISFFMGGVTSRDPRIQNKAGQAENRRSPRASIACVAAPPAGILVQLACGQIERDDGMGRLNGKVAVISGATSGIGLRTAEVFVAEGAKIVIAGRRVAEGEALAKKLGANCIFLKTDVTVEEQVRALI